MNYGIHRVSMDLPDDYMNIEMLEDMAFSYEELRFILSDADHGYLRVTDIDGHRLNEIRTEMRSNREFYLFAQLMKFFDPGTHLIAGRPSDIISDPRDMTAFYRDCMKRKIELVFRYTPELNTSLYAKYVSSANFDLVMEIVSELIELSERKKYQAGIQATPYFSNEVKKSA